MSEWLAGLPPPPPPAEPRPAAAVILWRERPGGRELFWVLRGEALSFAGGFYAFPGGRLDPADASVPVPGLEGETAAFAACACRELFEETGVLLARGTGRLSRAERDEGRRAALADHRGFGAFLSAKRLSLDASRLEPAGRWVTPVSNPVRFDARFFTARMPEGEEASVWPGELSAGEFVSPSRALELWERGDVLLHPSNWWSIHCLSRAAPPQALESLRNPPPDLRIEFQRGIWNEALRTPTLPPATHTNCWVLDLSDGTAVVDPGSPYPEEQERLDRFLDGLAAEGRPPREVWLTHHHADHVGGAARLSARGLEVLAHPLTATRVGLEARPVREGDLLHGRWRALHTPGHAPGHLAFHDERTGALLAGDMVSTLSTIVIDPPLGDMAEYLRQLERLRSLRPRTLFPAHGPPAPNGPGKLEEYIAHRRAREEKVLRALGSGGTLGEVTRLAYDDTPAAALPAAERSCLASLQKLCAEGRARLDGERWSLVR
ncbi:MAG TPA: MBL fold metallo-hydrolase [Anaeromyxobacteraceae bacterium]|nr:MBL fold metallo-hydrolase [Anaeromyxobacteraceae bacterium]